MNVIICKIKLWNNIKYSGAEICDWCKWNVLIKL